MGGHNACDKVKPLTVAAIVDYDCAAVLKVAGPPERERERLPHIERRTVAPLIDNGVNLIPSDRFRFRSHVPNIIRILPLPYRLDGSAQENAINVGGLTHASQSPKKPVSITESAPGL